ncbi:hypothetical protein [Streptomyces microflavus]|uniref:hypothetical protein n=1 Tax=Streptomyces microflavus TaxID=1919 RepID=UPI003820E110
MTTLPTDTVFTAVAHALRGDRTQGLRLLQPLIDEGPSSTFVTLVTLAEVAARPARREHGPDARLNPDTLGARSTDDLPPPARFAARFTAACANRDSDLSSALFWAVASHADLNRTNDLVEATVALFDMATAAASRLVTAALTPAADGPADQPPLLAAVCEQDNGDSPFGWSDPDPDDNSPAYTAP